MNCSTLAAQQKAAQEALGVSEHELQRIKQQGCFTTSQDRAIMRSPDYRALPYPALANPILSLEFDPNNKYSAINQAEGFVSPFIDGVTNQKVEARPTVPGASMAGTGDLAALAGVYLDSETTQQSDVYRRIADSIRGAGARESESSPTRQGLSEAALRQLAVEETTAERYEPVQSAAQVTAKGLYGSGEPRAPPQQELWPPPPAHPHRSFLQACRHHCRAALYDLMHYEALLPARLAAEGCRTKLGYVATREGRGPYLLTVLVVALLLLYLCWLLFRS
ncbi:MAG: hypothetical protein EBZ91_12000 [Gammaproteobacteria bacterium]|jgi:hypothetical protein|nr:hypothetical protein [Gammaproteobacteria bacterium]